MEIGAIAALSWIRMHRRSLTLNAVVCPCKQSDIYQRIHYRRIQRSGGDEMHPQQAYELHL